MEEYFSQYIKQLDETHKAILEQLKHKKEQLKQLEYQFYHEDESIAKELYALRSMKEPDMERIKELEEKQKALPSKQQLQEQIDIVQKEIKQLEDKFTNLPFEVAPMEITPYIFYQLENGCWLEQGIDNKGKPVGEYYYRAEKGMTATRNFKIIADQNNVPIEMQWLLQGSSTYGLPLRFKRKLILRQPINENLIPKVMEKEIIVEKPVYKPIEKILPSFNCSHCNWNLIDKLRMLQCPNCGLDLYTSLKQNIHKENKFNEQKKKSKWRLF
jgi:hypothetical protein